jgi:hypothetical protein
MRWTFEKDAAPIFSQIDNEVVTRHVLLDEIIDHRRGDGTVDKADAIVMMRNGVRRRWHRTQGWQLLCQLKDCSLNGVALKDARHLYTILVALLPIGFMRSRHLPGGLAT